MYLFNEAISALGIIELPLHGRHFTLTNKQSPPLLERVDWFFTSSSWTIRYPKTLVKTLVMETSDHWPCIIKIDTKIPRGKVFRFENHWLETDDFIPILLQGWSLEPTSPNPAKKMTAKYKNLRRLLKEWNSSTPSLASLISNVKADLHLLDAIECSIDLSLLEWNFREITNAKLISLLRQQMSYWKQRGKVNWVKEGDLTLDISMLMQQSIIEKYNCLNIG